MDVAMMCSTSFADPRVMWMSCVGRYRAELLERRGERLNSEGDLRGAIQDYQRVSSDFIIV